MLIKKITTGFVIQVFDTEKKDWVSQEFVCGDECDYETDETNDDGEFLDDKGEVVDDVCDLLPSPEPYLPYEMKQPEQLANEGWES